MSEKKKEGRRLGLDFYDLLIEEACSTVKMRNRLLAPEVIGSAGARVLLTLRN